MRIYNAVVLSSIRNIQKVQKMKQLTKHVWQLLTGLIQRIAEKEMIYYNLAFFDLFCFLEFVVLAVITLSKHHFIPPPTEFY